MILLVCTSLVEAKPLIDSLHLKFSPHKIISLYTRQNYALVITGKETIPIVIALTWCFANFPIQQLIHIGIAFTASNIYSPVFIVAKIIDDDSKREFYPDLIAKDKTVFTNINTVRTLAKIDETKLNNELVDTESSTIFVTANFFLNVDKISLIKVITQSSAINHTNLIKENLAIIQDYCSKLSLNSTNNADNYQDKIIIEEFTKKHHFTVTQTRELNKLLTIHIIKNPSLKLNHVLEDLSKLVLPSLPYKINNKKILRYLAEVCTYSTDKM